MGLLIDELKIKISERYKAKFQECNSLVGSLRKKIDDAMANYDQNLNRFRKDMEKMVP
jgi:dynein heavy chain